MPSAAGLSRVTLYRVEKGEPSVSMGAYLNVASALGLALELKDPAAARASAAAGVALPRDRDLKRAVTGLRERRGRLATCMEALQMSAVPRAVVWSRIRRLLPRR